MTPPTLQNKVFLLLLALVTIAFGAILWQFHGAVFWGVILAILFAPLHRKLLRRMPRRRNLAALCTLGLCLIVVILPMTAITVSLAQEATIIYERMRSGQLNFGLYLQQVIAALPAWAANLLDRLNLTTVGELQQRAADLTQKIEQAAATPPAATPAAPEEKPVSQAPASVAAPSAPVSETKSGGSGWSLYGALFGALTNLMLARSDMDAANAAYPWTVGSLNARPADSVLLLGIGLAVGLPLAKLLVNALSLMRFSDNVAIGLGVRLQRMRLLTLALQGLIMRRSAPASALAQACFEEAREWLANA